ncbi:MAG: DsbA family protein [Microgenomates group bacterium]
MKNNILTPLLTILLIVAVFFLGSFWTKIQYLEGNTNDSQAVAQQAEQQQQAPAPSGPVKVSIDDDPILGDKNAKVTIIEFSDYECPFCKRHFDETFPQLVKEYVDKGLVKIVFRDLPLSFHDPMATTEAIAANCAREQGDDSTYFKYHHEIFKRTKSNGNGLSLTDLYKISDDLKLNTTKLKTCIDDPKQKEEVQKDLSDASSVGASGTPAFFIGKSTDDGTIEAPLTSGAQPFSVFKTIIDELLK